MICLGEVGQPAFAKLENRTDMHVGNLRRFVEAMGGEVDRGARFPDGDVTINNFSELEWVRGRVELVH